MTSTPITLRLNDDLPAVTTAGAELNALNKNILDHAKEIYEGEGKNKGKQDLNTLVGTGRYDSKGNLRHANAVWDGLGWLSGRQKVIDALLNDTTRLESFREGPNNSGRYSGLNWVDRHIHKISDEDITKGLHRMDIRARNNSSEYREGLRDLTPQQRASVTSLTPLEDVQEMVKTEREYKALIDQIKAMDLSAEGNTRRATALAGKNGQRISQDDLELLATELLPMQRSDIRAVQAHDSQMDTEQTTRDVSTGTLDLQRSQEANNNAIRRSEIDYNNAKLQQDTDIANLKLKYEYDSANFDRELKRDLALLGLDSQREERQYRSERDQAQDRQMFILQLMKGLGGLGQSLGGY